MCQNTLEKRSTIARGILCLICQGIIDLSRELESFVQIEHENGLTVLSIVTYERLLDFCHHLQIVGHSVGSYIKLKGREHAAAHITQVNNRNPQH